MKLTERQRRFAEEYLIDLNATQAAIRAGYSSVTAAEQGSRLLKDVNIRARVDVAIAERSRRTGVNADRVVRELARLAFVNAPDVIDTLSATVCDTATEEDTAAIQAVRVKTTTSDSVSSVEREIKLADKVKALELLGKHLGMFVDRVQVQEVESSWFKDDEKP